MSDLTFDRWLLGASGMVALLVAASIMEYENTNRLYDDAAWVTHSHAVIDALQEMEISLQHAEVTQRTYLIVGDEDLLQELASSVADAMSMLQKLKTQTQDSSVQQRNIEDVEKRVNGLASHWFNIAEVRKEQGFDAARRMIQAGWGRAEMAGLESTLRRMDATERTLLRERAARTSRTFRSALWTGVLTSVVAVAGIVAFFMLLRRHLAARNAASAQMAAQASEASRRKDEFLATLAHELRNPLAPILNAVQGLRMIDAEKPEVVELRDMVERQVMHMIRLVDDLLEVNRITRGKVEVQKERINLLNAVQDAVETSGPFIESKRHELTVSLPERPIHVIGDQVRLAQVVTNLLNNAAYYTPEGGRIRLIVERDRGEALIRVQDNGLGIPSEALSQVFDLFTQIHGRQGGGLGIGLALVKQLVEIHGGRVEARSEGRGRGAEFFVRLPLAAEGRREEIPQKTERFDGAPSRRILVVDDNSDAAESTSILLAAAGHEVRTAYDGRTGIELAKAFRPEIVFLDLGMPDMDGFQTAKELRELQSDLKVIALTGWGQEADRRRSAEAHFDGHLVKPATFSALQEQIAHAQS